MKPRNNFNRFYLIFLSVSILFLCFCNTQKEEVVKIKELLPKGAIKEITHGHPDFKVTLVEKERENTSVKFGERYIRIDGIEEEKLRGRLASFVLKYLENPNKRAEDKAKKEAYKRLPPKEKMKEFIKRMKNNFPDFEYEWVALGQGNVKIEYGDNSLIISGVEKDGNREEIAHGLIRIQKDIDKLSTGEQE